MTTSRCTSSTTPTRSSWNTASAAHAITLASGPLTLARIGKQLLRREMLKQTLDNYDREVFKVCRAIPPMRQELDAYDAAGRPPAF